RVFLGKLSDGKSTISPEEAAEIIEEQEESLRRGRYRNLGSAGVGGRGSGYMMPATEGDLKAADNLERLVDELRKLNEQTQAANEERKRTTEAAKNNRGIPAG